MNSSKLEQRSQLIESTPQRYFYAMETSKRSLLVGNSEVHILINKALVYSLYLSVFVAALTIYLRLCSCDLLKGNFVIHFWEI